MKYAKICSTFYKNLVQCWEYKKKPFQNLNFLKILYFSEKKWDNFYPL